MKWRKIGNVWVEIGYLINYGGKRMKIETKYNLGQEVWVMSIGKPFCTTIIAIRIDEIGLQYILKYISARDEKDIYPTKEELLKSL